MSAPSSPPPPSTSSSSGGAARTAQACAACRYQRRKCTADCILARYFLPDRPELFDAAYRLFGVNKILQMIRDLNDDHRNAAMRNILFHSMMRAQNPVDGCLGVIKDLEAKISAVSAALQQHQHVLEMLISEDAVSQQAPLHGPAAMNSGIPSPPPPQPPENDHGACQPATPTSDLTTNQGLQADPNVQALDDDIESWDEIFGALSPIQDV